MLWNKDERVGGIKPDADEINLGGFAQCEGTSNMKTETLTNNDTHCALAGILAAELEANLIIAIRPVFRPWKAATPAPEHCV